MRDALVAIGALIISALLLVSRAGVAEAQASAGGAFAFAPTFSAGGQAAAVFLGGSVGQLEAAARDHAASGVWVQDGSGAFQLLVVGGPAFLRDAFTSRFPTGFASAIAVTLTRPPGAAGAPPPVLVPVPAAPTATPFPTGVPGPSTNN